MNIGRRDFLKRAGLVTAGVVLGTALDAGAADKPKPNILFIISDDQGIALNSISRAGEEPSHRAARTAVVAFGRYDPGGLP